MIPAESPDEPETLGEAIGILKAELALLVGQVRAHVGGLFLVLVAVWVVVVATVLFGWWS